MSKKQVLINLMDELESVNKGRMKQEELVNALTATLNEIEMIHVPVILGSNVIIRTPAQQETWELMKKKMALSLAERDDNTRHFMMTFHDTLENIEARLETKAAGVALTLSLYMDLGSNGILKINGNHMTKQDLYEILGLEQDMVKKVTDTLKDLNVLTYKREAVESVITRGKNKGKTRRISGNVYRMDTNFSFMGSFDKEQKDRSFTKTFKEEAKKYLEYISLDSRGFLLMLLKNIHFQNFYLVHNPNADYRLHKNKDMPFYKSISTEAGKLYMYETQKSLNLNDMIQLTGKSRRTIERYLRELEYSRILLKNGRGQKAIYQVNPRIFTRQEGVCHYTETIITQFDLVKPKTAPKNVKK